MASRTITTTAAQETALAHVVARVNAERAAQSPALPALSVAEYLQHVVGKTLDSYISARQERHQQQIRDAWQTASAAERTAALAALGVTLE